MAVKEKKAKLIPLRKGNEQRKVLAEYVETYLKAGWFKVEIVKGKRDAKTNLLLEGQEDTVKLVGLETEDIASLKAENAKLLEQVTTLQAEVTALKTKVS